MASSFNEKKAEYQESINDVSSGMICPLLSSFSYKDLTYFP